MSPPLDESYLRWLYGRVSARRPKPPATWWKLFRFLYTQEFVWFVPNDDNRVTDGLELRLEFVERTEAKPDDLWLGLGCSVLEMLIAMSRRLAFEGGGEPAGWFWILIHNLGLDTLNDERFDQVYSAVPEGIIHRLIWRQYNYNGTDGGMFPLQHAMQDQRDVEIWYQMQAWLLENE